MRLSCLDLLSTLCGLQASISPPGWVWVGGQRTKEAGLTASQGMQSLARCAHALTVQCAVTVMTNVSSEDQLLNA